MAKKNESLRIPKTVLSEQVKEKLLDALLHGEYLPGDRLVESQLSVSFGVSQSPVREAIKSLEEMGLVTVEPYKGTTVRKITNQEIREIFVVRAALESTAAGIAAEKITPRDSQKLEKILRDMIETAESGDIVKRVKLNNQFHEEIIRISENGLILKLSKTLRFASWSHVKAVSMHNEGITICTRHRKILEALNDHDSVLAERLMREHVEEYVPNVTEEETPL